MAIYSRKEIEAGALKKSIPVSKAEKLPEPVKKEVKPSTPEPVKQEAKKYTADDPWYTLQHPECTRSFRPSCKMTVNGETVEMENGRIETQNVSLRDSLIKMGYRWMNEEF